MAAAKGQNDFAAGSPPAANTKILAAARQATTSNFVFAAGGQAAAMEVIKDRSPLVTSLKRRPTKSKISEQNRNSEIQNASVQMHFFPVAKPLAVIILLLLSGEQVSAGAVLPR